MSVTAAPSPVEAREMRGEDLVGPALRAQGVQDLFFMMGIGGPDSPAVRSCIDEGIRSYYIRHESAAAMAAHAYARLTRRPGVCVTPLGPGTTNAITGMATALLDAAPVVLLGGGTNRGDWGREAYQEQDQMGMLRPATKAAFRVELPQRIPEVIAMAFQKAVSGRKGPVYVELPHDVLRRRIDPARVAWPEGIGEPPRPAGSDAEIERAVDVLQNADRPLMLCGSGIVWSAAGGELQRFIEAANVPLVTTPQTRGVIPEDHPLVLTASRSRAMREADVVLVVGTRANWINSHLLPPRFAADARFVVVNLDPDEIGRGRVPAVGIVGDAATVLRQLRAAIEARETPSTPGLWTQQLIDRDASRVPEPEATSDVVPIHPLRLCEEVRRALPRDAVFIVDGHETLEFARRAIPSLSEGNYLTTGPNGCMGVGVPFAVGAKVACPDRPVFVLMGDGGFGWHGMEYDTLARHELPVVGIVFNNGGFTARPAAGGVGRELGYRRYDVVVEGLGGYGEFVEHPGDIADAIKRAVASGKPALVNVCVDPDAQAAGGLLGVLGSARAAPVGS